MITTYRNGLQFNGSSQYTARASVSSAVNNFTVIVFAKLNGLPSAGNFGCFFNNGNVEGNGYVLGIDENGLFSFDISFVTNVSSSQTISQDTLYMLGAIRSGGTSQCIVNGFRVGATSGSAPNVPGSNSTVGASQNAGGTAFSYVNATLYEVRLYERALSDGEILKLNNLQTDSSVDVDNIGLKLWLKLSETDTTTQSDSSGNGLTFTSSGSPSAVTGLLGSASQQSGFANNTRTLDVGDGMGRSESAT